MGLDGIFLRGSRSREFIEETWDKPQVDLTPDALFHLSILLDRYSVEFRQQNLVQQDQEDSGKYPLHEYH